MNESIRNLLERKSCKQYRPEPIPREALVEILAAGQNAPSGMNRQTPLFVAVSKPETVRLLSRLNAAVLGSEGDPFYGAPQVIVVLARKEGTYLQDGSLAMGNLLNAAYAIGVGACWIHRAKEVFETAEGQALLQTWGITDPVEGIGFCTVGHAAGSREKPAMKQGRVFYVD